MSWSLRRALAVRFAATMAVGLAAASAAVLLGVTEAVRRPADTGLGVVIVALAGIILVGTSATLFGAWWLAGSAIRPVNEITAQATRIEGGTLDQRIVAHANTQEYEGLVRVLNRMLERLERAFSAQRRLTADVSHELRTPLTALRGEVEVALRSERAPRDYQRVLHSALEEIDRLSRITEDALLITRADGSGAAASLAPTDFNALLRDLLTRWEPRMDGAGVQLDVALDAGLQELRLDGPLIARMVEHLLDNALRHTPAGGRVEVRTEIGAAGVARLRVADSGPGLAASDVSHMFEPFYRVDASRQRARGAGLGLAVVAAVARLHGGTVKVDSAPGRGARFEVELPTRSA